MTSVSVVMPVYNAAPFVAETIEAVLAQTYEAFEFVIHDDGSTDDTPAILARYAARDSRIVVQSAENRGVDAAANAAIKRASGDLLVRIDGDDLCRPNRIEALVDLANAHPEVDVFASRVRYFPREHVGPGMERYEAWINGLLTHEEIMADRFVEYPLPHPSTAVRRGAFERVGGFVGGPIPEDYDWFLRACAEGLRFLKHPDVLLDWREGAHRTTKSDGRYTLDAFFRLKFMHLLPILQTQGRAVVVVGAGRDGKRWARALAGTGVSCRAFVDLHPGRVGNRIHDLPVLGYEAIPDHRDAFFLSAVGAPGARADVRARLREAGLAEETDFLCVQ